MAGWLAGWLDGWLVGWMDGWLVGWLDGWMVGWLVGWLYTHQPGVQCDTLRLHLCTLVGLFAPTHASRTNAAASSCSTVFHCSTLRVKPSPSARASWTSAMRSCPSSQVGVAGATPTERHVALGALACAWRVHGVLSKQTNERTTERMNE